MTVTAAEQIPGVTAREVEVMLLGAVEFLRGVPDPLDGTGPSLTLVKSAAAMRALQEPVSPEGAGKVSARRDYYKRQQGTHFMAMPYLGNEVSQPGIPGISAREWEVMAGAARAFLAGRETGPAQIASVGGMRALLVAAPAEVAGRVSAGRDEYFPGTGQQWMCMAPRAVRG